MFCDRLNVIAVISGIIEAINGDIKLYLRSLI